MDAQVQVVLEKVADYVALTQPLLDKVAEHRELQLKRAEQASALLIERGLLSKAAKEGFINRIANDESGTAVWDVVQKLAETVAPEQYGKASAFSAPVGELTDPFDKWLFGERSSNPIG